MFQVYLFEENSMKTLQDKINKWMSNNRDKKIIDVKYSTTTLLGVSFYSAMVLYNTEATLSPHPEFKKLKGELD